MLSILSDPSFEIAESQSVADELSDQLDKLQEKDVRIILGNFDEVWARKIFCQAYKKKMYGKNYQWIIQGGKCNYQWIIQGGKCNYQWIIQAGKCTERTASG